MTRVQTNRLFILFFLIGVIGVSCNKDPLITKPRHFGLQEMLDRGNILDLGVSNSSVTMFNDKDELVLFDRWDSTFKFFNDINSRLNTRGITGVQRLNDSTVTFCDNQNGIRYFYQGNIYYYLSSGGIKFFNVQNQIAFIGFSPTLVSGPNHLRMDNGAIGSNIIFTCAAGQNDTLYSGTEKDGILRSVRTSGISTKLINDETIFDINNQFIGACVQMAFDSQGNLWTLTTKGLVKYNARVKEFIPLPEFEIGKHMVIYNDTIYVVTNKGISLLEDGKIVPFDPLVDVFQDNYINVMEIDTKGRFWIGTTNGLYKFTN